MIAPSSLTWRQIIVRFLEPVKKEPYLWLKAWCQYLLFAIWGLISAFFLKLISQSIEWHDLQLMYKQIVYFVICAAIYYILRIYTKDRGRAVIRTKFVSTIYQTYIPKFIMLENTYVDKLGTGRMISIIQKWFDMWVDLLDLLFRKGIHIILIVCVSAYMIGAISAYLLLWFIALFVSVHICTNRLNILILKNKRLYSPIQNEYTRSLVKILMSKFEIMLQDKTQTEIQKLDRCTNHMYDITTKRTLYVELVYLIPNALMMMLWISMFLVLGTGIVHDVYTFSDLLVFSYILWLLYQAMDISATTIKDFFQKYNDIEELRDTFDHADTTWYDHWLPFVHKSWDIKIDNLTFWYGNNTVFQNFNLQIAWWSKVAFVWESGSGKTTLIKLLAGYIRPDSGEIVIDDQKLSETKLIDYYKHIWYLTQDPSVFDGTIYENLLYALDTTPNAEDFHRVIKLAKCDFIREFETWLETEIGEKWIRLSWGQKQRLAIAKIMLKNPSIIFLDEPTSALDSFNEEQISIALYNLFKGKTVIIVAHRLQTVKQADTIFLLEKGKIVEQWTHDQLVKLNGNYKRMLDLQSGF